MERIEYRNVVDKTDWTRGPWDSEPDKIQWQDEATGLPCMIVRGPSGALCGYVGLLPGHPFHGKSYDDPNVDVHGGLTFGGHCADTSQEKWQKWRERMLARKDEAKRYPKGDAARDLKEWGAGLNNYDAWVEHAEARFICHRPGPGEPDDIYWLGFDCAHSGDICPSHDRISGRYSDWEDVYRDLAYVENEVRSLARQLAALKG